MDPFPKGWRMEEGVVKETQYGDSVTFLTQEEEGVLLLYF
jgi:hypothetical protein